MALTLHMVDAVTNRTYDMEIPESESVEDLARLVAAKVGVSSPVRFNGIDQTPKALVKDLKLSSGSRLVFQADIIVPASPSRGGFDDAEQPTLEDDPADWGEFEEGQDGGLELVEEDIPGPTGLFRQRSYVIMGKVQINEKQKDMIEEISTVLNLGVSSTALMLRHYKWDPESLLKDYTADPEETMAKCGVKPGDNDDGDIKEELGGAVSPVPAEEKEFDCPFCACSYPLDETHALECGHRFCLGCWKSWFCAKSEDGAECIFTKCMAYECKVIVPADFMLLHLPKDIGSKVADWMINGFVKMNAFIKWCPRNGCDKAVEYRKAGIRTVTCECGHQFCFNCGFDCHDPATCEHALEWTQKDNSLIQWLKENRGVKDVKCCTKCHEIIEKNQGCKHMTCRNCKHEFCWLCFQNWHGHNESLCNNYEQKEKEQEAKELGGDQNAEGLRRYQFYFTRYENHQKAIRFAERMRGECEKKMNKMQDLEGSSLNAVSFLLDAVNGVIECRRLLQWSYVWAFNMKEESQLRIHFKMHQDMLEEMTEELQGLTEQPLKKLLESKLRTAIINHTRVVAKFRHNIVEFAKANR